MIQQIYQELSPAQAQLVRRLKAAEAPWPISLTREDGASMGSLTPITAREAADAALCAALTEWRQAARECFMTQFDATPARTRSWLERNVLPDDTRLLFLLRDAANRPIGNIGLCGIAADAAEIDNVLRGELAPPRCMFYALLALVRWTFTELRVAHLTLQVFSNNERALRLYSGVGFQHTDSVPLARMERGGEVRYEARRAEPLEQVDFELVRMQLTMSEFWSRHAWLRPGEED